MKQFDVFPAVFSPKRRDDLKPGAENWIGWRGLWEAAYIIEEGQYEGEWACTVRPDQPVHPPASVFVWTPESDLSQIGEPTLLEFMAAASTAIRASTEFEQAMNDVKLAAGASPEQVAALSNQILRGS